ncbi:MAG: ABC transporter ATP-binding protein, partial [Acetatifactor sp.]|nr:ABC transporter ATP-binding protein [Acetatifactor sp.]
MIHLQKVNKKYGDKWVLRDITHSFGKGSATAFVGHNGCGKSTMLKLLSGVIRPTQGLVQYDRSLIFHYVPEKFPVINLTAEQYLLHMGRIDGLPEDRLQSEIQELAGEFYMAEHLQSRMATLSKGTLQKVGVIQALLTMPDVLLLDEPLSGQDVDAQKVFIEKVNDLRGRELLCLCPAMSRSWWPPLRRRPIR